MFSTRIHGCPYGFTASVPASMRGFYTSQKSLSANTSTLRTGAFSIKRALVTTVTIIFHRGPGARIESRAKFSTVLALAGCISGKHWQEPCHRMPQGLGDLAQSLAASQAKTAARLQF